MRARLQDREWSCLIFLGVMFLVLIIIAYTTKDCVDPAVQNFFNSQKI